MRTRAAGLFVGISVIWVPLAFLFDGVTVLLLPLRLDASATLIGLVSLVGIGTATLLQPLAGWLSDRLRGRIDRRLFIAGAAVPSVAGLALFVGTESAAAALAAFLLIQLGATAIQGGQQALIPEHVAGSARGKASGWKVAFDVGGAFVAFLVLGALAAGGDLVPAALAIAAVLAVAIVLLLVLVPRAPLVPGRPRLTLDLPPGLATLIAARFLFLFGTFAVGRFLVLLVADRLGMSVERAVTDAAWLLALLTLATAVGAVLVGWAADRLPRRELMAAGALLSAAGIALLAPSLGLAGLLAGGLLMSLGTALFVTANWAATTDLAPPTDAGRLMGIANLGTGLAAAMAGLLGPVIELGGFAPALAIAAAVTAATLLPIGTSLASSRRKEEHAL